MFSSLNKVALSFHFVFIIPLFQIYIIYYFCSILIWILFLTGEWVQNLLLGSAFYLFFFAMKHILGPIIVSQICFTSNIYTSLSPLFWFWLPWIIIILPHMRCFHLSRKFTEKEMGLWILSSKNLKKKSVINKTNFDVNINCRLSSKNWNWLLKL